VNLVDETTTPVDFNDLTVPLDGALIASSDTRKPLAAPPDYKRHSRSCIA
jgi:hypothetical protein